MPAIDDCEPQVIQALQKDGWIVVQHHYHIRLGQGKGAVYADLRVQKDNQQVLIIEIKCSPEHHPQLDGLYGAIGQYFVYRAALRLRESPVSLYLAMPVKAYRRFMAQDAIRMALKDARIRLVLIDLEQKEIATWIH